MSQCYFYPLVQFSLVWVCKANKCVLQFFIFLVIKTRTCEHLFNLKTLSRHGGDIKESKKNCMGGQYGIQGTHDISHYCRLLIQMMSHASLRDDRVSIWAIFHPFSSCWKKQRCSTMFINVNNSADVND